MKLAKVRQAKRTAQTFFFNLLPHHDKAVAFKEAIVLPWQVDLCLKLGAVIQVSGVNELQTIQNKKNKPKTQNKQDIERQFLFHKLLRKSNDGQTFIQHDSQTRKPEHKKKDQSQQKRCIFFCFLLTRTP